jgi:uncharacterized protein YndB with AHSA1/START domain
VTTRLITMERTVDAPPDRVYRMWSDADTLNQWLSFAVEGSLLPGARSVLVFPRQRIEVDVLEAEPYGRMRFRWIHAAPADRSTEVTVTIAPRGWGSRVTLTDGPYEVDDEAGLDAYAEAIEIWAAALTQLRASVDYSIDLRMERRPT